MGGKSKSTTVGYHYRPAFHVGLVGRPIDAFLEYRAADKTAWAGELTASGRIQIDAPDLFGGEKDQGGIVGPVDVMFGEPDQVPNPYLVEVFGDQTVAWRGMTTLVFAGGRFGAMNPYQQKSAYKIRKIKAGWDGDWGDDPCWYPETAEIPLLDGAVTMHGPGWEYQIEHFSEPNTVWSNFEFPVDGWLQGGELPWDTNGMAGGEYWTPTRSNIWLRRRITVHGAGLTLNIGADNGCVVWINGVNVGSSNPTNEPLPGNQNNPVSYNLSVAGPLDVIVKAYAEIVPSDDIGNVVSLSFTGARLVGINPAHLLYYVRTDREKGAEPASAINEASLKAAADRLYAEGFGLCQVVYDPQQDTPDSFMERICRIIGGSFERSLVDGQWYLDLARGIYDVDSLPIMGDDDILELKRQPTTLHGVTNSLSVRYFDPARKETIITPAVRALGLVRAFGEVHETLDFPEIPTADLALTVAERELRSRITPSETFEVVTRPRADLIGLRRSQYFRLQSPKRGIAEMVCIVGEKDMGTLRSGAIRWKVAQDIYGHPEATYIEVEHGVDARPPQVPAPIVDARVFEAPYIDLAAMLPRAELEALPDDAGFLLGVAARPSHGLGYTMAVKPEGGEFFLAASGEWCPTATTADEVPVGLEPVEVRLASARALDRVPVGSAVLMGDEILRLDAKQLDPLQVTLARGCADTLPVAHPSGARMWFIGEDAAVDATEYAEGESVEVKFLSHTGSQQLPLDAAQPHPLTFAARSARPYPPAGVLINGMPYPDPEVPLTGDIELTWRSRDRILQADQLVDQVAASIGPEPGATVTVEYWNADGSALLHSEEGVPGVAAAPWTPPADGMYRVEAFSVLNDLESWQRYSWMVLVGSAPAPALWTPGNLAAAPKVWCDWDSSIGEVDGRASSWENKGSFGGDFSQGASAAQPVILPSEVGGKRVLRFDGSNDLMALASGVDLYRNTTGGWVFTVHKRRGEVSGEQFVFRSHTGGGGTRLHVNHGPGASIPNTVGLSVRRLDSDVAGGLLSTSTSVGDWLMSYAAQNWGTREGVIYLDGVLDASSPSLSSAGSTSNTAGSTGPTIGASSVGAIRAADMDLACIVAGDGGVLNLPDRLRLEGWAAWAVGLQSNLPTGHPYRDAPPYVQSVPSVSLGAGGTEVVLAVPYVQGVEVSGGTAWVTSSGESTVLRRHDKVDWSVLASATLDDLTPGFTATSLGDPTLHDGVLYIPCGVYSASGAAFVIEVDPDTLAYIAHHDLSAYCGSGLNSIVRHGGLWYAGESAASDPSVQPALRVFDDDFAHVGVAWESYSGARVDFQGATMVGGAAIMAAGGHDDWLYLFHLSGAGAELVDAIDLGLSDIQGVTYHAGEIYATYRQSGQKIERYEVTT